MTDHEYAMALVRKRPLQLVFFPGEANEGDRVAGHIYAYLKGKMVASIEACGGPPPGQEEDGPGGHSAGATPWGNYVLGYLEHHTTQNWPMSAVPWGAKLRENAKKEIEFSKDDGKTWLPATGPKGATTLAYNLFDERTEASAARLQKRAPRPLTQAQKDENNAAARRIFYDAPGQLKKEYDLNDFGKWSWNLMQNGSRTQYYVHTTPDDEHATAAGRAFKLSNSHGCVHIKPADREAWREKGYLKAGNPFFVAHYGVKGP